MQALSNLTKQIMSQLQKLNPGGDYVNAASEIANVEYALAMVSNIQLITTVMLFIVALNIVITCFNCFKA